MSWSWSLCMMSTIGVTPGLLTRDSIVLVNIELMRSRFVSDVASCAFSGSSMIMAPPNPSASLPVPWYCLFPKSPAPKPVIWPPVDTA